MVSIEVLSREDIKSIVENILGKKFDYLEALILKMETKVMALDGIVGKLQDNVLELEKEVENGK